MRAIFLFIVAVLASSPAAAAGPSFDCGRVTSQVNKLICSSPELSALDAKLANDYSNMKGQPDVDARALARDEDSWLRKVRNACSDAACLKNAYEARDAQILNQSRRAASPAAYAETRPFPVDATIAASAMALIGKPCGGPGEDIPAGSGFASRTAFQPVIGPDTVVVPRAKKGAWFAFLLVTKDGCRVTDAVALPGPKAADAFLSCNVPADAGSATPQSMGFGMRKTGHKFPVAYWEVDAKSGKLIRQPLGVLGWSDKIVCNYPESGE